MNTDKLYEAARSEAFDLKDSAHATDSKDLVEAFVSGAKWLQSQPLSDRLSENEKEKIRAFYDGDTFGELDFIEVVSARRLLKNIFGKDMFLTDGDS